MTDAGFFRGTSAEQDNRFSDKEKKLLKQMKFAENLVNKVEMHKIKLESIKPWITKRISELLGMEDDVVVEFVINQLEAEKNPDARKIQINLTGFLNGKNARIFMGELWEMLLSAQENAVGIPTAMIEAKKEEIKKRNEEQERINETLKRTVSKFNDRLIKQERESSPNSNRRDRSRDASRDRARSRSKDKDSKSRSKHGDSDETSKSREDSSQQSKRNYRNRRSSSASPETNHRRRSRSGSRDRKSDRRPGRDLMEDIRDRDRGGGGRGGYDRSNRGGARDFRDRPRPRSPPRGQRRRSRSPYRAVVRRSPSPTRRPRRSPPASNNRDFPARRDSGHGEQVNRRNENRRSRSRSPIVKESRPVESEFNKKAGDVSPQLDESFRPNKIGKRSTSPERVEISKKRSKDSSSEDSSSSQDTEVDKSDKTGPIKKKDSNSSNSDDDDQSSKKRKEKEKKKKKDKKHKKHKKHKKLKKSKQKGSSDEENGNGIIEEEEPVVIPEINPSIAKSILKLVDSASPIPEDLERKLREKALESMKKKSASLN